jgi:Ca-activated chloride channel family protein
VITFPDLQSPLWLALLALLPLLAWWHHRRAGAGALTYSRLPEGAGGSWRLHLPFYLRLAALALLVVALARPRLGYAWEESLTEGIDIQVALDVSGSMAAEDFQPKNRLEVAKEVVKDFVAGRTGDRIGLVVFSGAALTRAPLTTDREMLSFLIDTVEIGTPSRGTAIGVALATAANRLKESEAETQVIVLVTDGVSNAGEIDPRDAAALCDGLGIRVYTIGVGTDDRVRVPVDGRDPASGRMVTRWRLRQVPIDEPLMRAIAERTGGRYFRATDREALSEVFATIDELERTEIEVKRFLDRHRGGGALGDDHDRGRGNFSATPVRFYFSPASSEAPQPCRRRPPSPTAPPVPPLRVLALARALGAVAPVRTVDVSAIAVSAQVEQPPAVVDQALDLPKIVHSRARPPRTRPPSRTRATTIASNASTRGDPGSER